MVDPRPSPPAARPWETTSTSGTSTTTTPTRTRTISSRYLEAVSRGRHRDYASFLASTAATAAASTPNRPSSKRPRTPTSSTPSPCLPSKLNVSTSGMTATTAALDISESWSSSRGTPSRPNGTRTVGTEGTGPVTPIHQYHDHHDDAPHRPLGMEGDCSSIDSSSSHHQQQQQQQQQRHQPAHILLLDHDDRDPLKDDASSSYDCHDDYHDYHHGTHHHPLESSFASDSPVGTTTTAATRTTQATTSKTHSSPSRRWEKAREHWARRRTIHSISSSTTTKKSVKEGEDHHHHSMATTPLRGMNTTNNSHQNVNVNNHPTPHTTPRADFFPRTTPSTARTSTKAQGTTSSSSPSKDARPRPHKETAQPWNRTRSRWESKQFADDNDDDDDDPRLSEAGAPTEIMTNRASDVRKQLFVPRSDSGAPTEVVTNRASDLLIRHLHTPPQPTPPPQPPAEPQDPPMVKRWSGRPEKDHHKKQMMKFSLIDTMSTHDESSALSPERPYTQSLIDAHSPTISTSTDKSSKQESIGTTHQERQNHQWNRTVGYTTVNHERSGGPIVGSEGTGVQAQQIETHGTSLDETYRPMSPVRFYVLEDHMPQPNTPQETLLSGEVTSSVSTTDKLLLPADDNELRTTTFVRYNSRQTPNAHEVFQRRCSVDDSSHASTISTLDKEQDAGYACCENAIQPLFSLDRLDFSRHVQSPIRTHQRSKSQGLETPAAIEFFSTPPRSKSFDETIGDDGPSESQMLHEPEKRKTSNRFAVVRDSPDPIICPAGSLSFSSHGFESSLMAGTHNKEGVVPSGRSVRGWPAVTTSESTGTGLDLKSELHLRTKGHDGSTPRGSAPRTNPSPPPTGTVHEKIQAFNRIPPPRTVTHKEVPLRVKHVARTTLHGDRIDDEKKEQYQQYDDDDDTVSVKSLKEKFDRPVVSTHIKQVREESHDKNKEETPGGDRSRRETWSDRIDTLQGKEHSIDNRGLRSVQERMEKDAKKQHLGLQGKLDDDDRSVRSLQEYFEARVTTAGQPRHDGNDDSVQRLHKQFERKNLLETRDNNHNNNRDVLSVQKNVDVGLRTWQPNQNWNHDCDDRSVSSLKKQFEGGPAKQQRGLNIEDGRDDRSRSSFKNKLQGALADYYSGQSGEDDSDDRSVQSLKKKFEGETMKGKRLHVQNSEERSDDRSVSGLKKKFESWRTSNESIEDDGDDRSVCSLKKKFEGGKTKRNPFKNQEDDSDDRSVSSLKKKFEVRPTKRLAGEVVGNLKSVFESKMISHGKRSLQNSWMRASHTDKDSVHRDLQRNMPPRGTRNFRAPQSYVQDTRLQQQGHDAYVSVNRSDTEPDRTHQDHATPLSCASPEIYDRSIAIHIMKNHVHQSEANIPDAGAEMETLSSSSSRVRGPTATSFLATRDRLLQFAKAEPTIVETQPSQPPSRATPPSMHQRLNRWATRYQAQKTSSPVTLLEDPQDTAVDSQAERSRSRSYDRSSLVQPEQNCFNADTNSRIVRNLESVPQRTEFALLRSDSASTAKAHFVFEENDPTDRHGRMSRSDFRGKSGDSEDSDGVTLDASIAEVSILTDQTMVKAKENKDTHALDFILGARAYSAASRHSITPSSTASPRKAVQVQSTNMQHDNKILDGLTRESHVAEIDLPMQLLPVSSIGGTPGERNKANLNGSDIVQEIDEVTKSISYDITPERSFNTSAGSHVFEKKDSLKDSDDGWDIELISKSFSQDFTPERSFVTAEDSHVFDREVWPPLDDIRWFDFSDNADTNSVNAIDGNNLAWDSHGTSLSTENSSKQEDRHGRGLSSTHQALDRLRQDDPLLLYAYSVDKSSRYIHGDLSVPARCASSQINGPISAEERAAHATHHEKKPAKMDAHMIRLFSRTHPSSHASGVQSAARMSENRINRTKKTAPRTSTRNLQTETPKKNGGGLFSRVAWSLSRSSTNDNFVSRLNSVKASRLLRKKSTGHLPGHKLLRDDDDSFSVQSKGEEGDRAITPSGNPPFVLNEPTLQPRRYPQQQDPPKVTFSRTSRPRDPPGATNHTTRLAMDMRTIIPTASEEFHPRRISRRQMPVHTFNATSKISNFFKVDAPRSAPSTPIGPSRDEIRLIVGTPPPPPPRSTNPITGVIALSSPKQSWEERSTVMLSTEPAKQVLESSPMVARTERTSSFRARYCEAVTRSTSLSTRQPVSAPRVRFQPTMKPPLPPSTRHSSFGSAHRINCNSLFGRVRYQDEMDRESSSSSNTSGFSHYFLD